MNNCEIHLVRITGTPSCPAVWSTYVVAARDLDEARFIAKDKLADIREATTHNYMLHGIEYEHPISGDRAFIKGEAFDLATPALCYTKNAVEVR